MGGSVATRRPPRSVAFDGLVVAAGVVLFLWSVAESWRDGGVDVSLTLVAVPLIALMARYPLVLRRDSGDIEIGFDSAMVVVLALVAAPAEAIAIWGLGVVLAQSTLRKSAASRVFNVGLGLVLGWVTVHVMHGIAPLGTTHPRELLAVAVGAGVYFVADYVLTGLSLAVETGGWFGGLTRDVTVPLSAAIFVGVDALGYVAAVLSREVPWSLPLLATPLLTLLYAARAYQQANDNRASITALFGAARDAHQAVTAQDVLSILVANARRLLNAPHAALRHTPPGPREIGVLLPDVEERETWIVAPRRPHAPRRDQRTLETLAAIALESLARVRLVGEMAHLARHDPLTGLANRALFGDRVQHAVARARRHPRPMAVLFVDLDGFKAVNDSLGHDAGDQLLVTVAARLQACIRPGDTAARLGGDEFAVLLEEMTEESDAAEVARRVLTELRAPVRIAGADVSVGASIGVALHRDGDDVSALLRHSDLAMYHAKELGKGRFHVFEPSLWESSRERLSLEGDLRTVLDRAELRLSYQPVVDLATGAIDGFEALLRWDHPGYGDVAPLRFVPIAEETGLIRDIGGWVLEQAYADAAAWARRHRRPVRIAVNLSAQQLSDDHVVDRVADLRARHPEPVQLVLEITESTFVREHGDDIRRLRALHDLGVQLAIDDFGTGYSSIAYLRHMPLDILKVDRSFVADVASDGRAAGLVEAIVAMAQSLDLRIVAEGIEQPEQALALHTMGIQYGQGYWFARPMPASEAADLIGQRAPRTVTLPARRSPARSTVR